MAIRQCLLSFSMRWPTKLSGCERYSTNMPAARTRQMSNLIGNVSLRAQQTAGGVLARNFNGTSDEISSGNPTVAVTNFSLSFWALKTAQTSVNSMGAYNGSSGSNGWGIYIPANSLTPNALFGGIAVITGSIAITAGAWNRYTLTRDSSTTTLYIGSGVSVTSGSTPNAPTTAFTIGADTGGEFWGGNITDIAVWTIALTPTQVANLAAGRRANTIGANVNLVDHLPILGASPEVDQTGNGNTGVLTGTTVVAGPPQLDPFVASGSFNPTSLITGAGGFWRADTGVTLSGSSVTAWADQTAFGNNLSAIPTQPTFSGTGFNSAAPGITFPTGGAGLLNASVAFAATATCSVFILLQKGAAGTGFLRYFSLITSGNNDFTLPSFEADEGNVSGNVFQAGASGVSFGNGSAPFSLSTGGLYLLGFTLDGVHSNMWVNGAVQGAAVNFSSNVGGAGSNTISCGPVGGVSPVAMTVAFWGITQKAMNSTDWTNLKNWCNANWGTSF
jgi:hypothetical protein